MAYAADSILVVATTSGLTDFTLGSALAGYRSFSAAAVPTGSVIHYSARTPTEFENGEGVYSTTGPTLTRVTIFASSNANNKVNFGSAPNISVAPLFEDYLTIRDLNNNRVFTYSATAAAVNYLDVLNNSAGNGPIISAQGTDTDVSIVLKTKGNGGIVMDLTSAPDGGFPTCTILSDATDSSGAGFLFQHATASPAGFDQIGFFSFFSSNNVGANKNYSSINSYIWDPTNGSEEGYFQFLTSVAGSSLCQARVKNGWIIGDAFSWNGSGSLHCVGTQASTSTTTGSLVADGGAGIAGALNVGAMATLASLSRNAPIIKTADFTVGAAENWLINNKASTACTVTLPTASSFVGRELMFTNRQALAVISASSNVVPKAGGSATTAILSATIGVWCKLVSDGTNWIIMQAGT